MAFRSNALKWPRPAMRNADFMGTDIPNIFAAAASDDVAGIDAALAGGVDVNSVDDELMASLHYASAHLAMRAVDRLLEELSAVRPLDATLVDAYGRTASSIVLEVRGSEGIAMADKLRPYCYPSPDDQ